MERNQQETRIKIGWGVCSASSSGVPWPLVVVGVPGPQSSGVCGSWLLVGVGSGAGGFMSRDILGCVRMQCAASVVNKFGTKVEIAMQEAVTSCFVRVLI